MSSLLIIHLVDLKKYDFYIFYIFISIFFISLLFASFVNANRSLQIIVVKNQPRWACKYTLTYVPNV